MGETRYEYGVRCVRHPDGWEPHRDGMTEEEARQWVAEWVEDGGKPGVFVPVRRALGEWEDA